MAPPHLYNRKTCMETLDTQTIEEREITGYHVLGMSAKLLLQVILLALLFLGLCVIVFAGETERIADNCDLSNGPYAARDLTREQRERMRQMSNKLSNDTAFTRARMAEKRLELKRAARDPNTCPYTTQKLENELATLQQELFAKIQRTHSGQSRLLTPEQANRFDETPYKNGFKANREGGYGRREKRL